MPILTYFAVTAPVLLVCLLAVASYLDPNNTPRPADFLAIKPAHASITTAPPESEPISDFARLKIRPLESKG